MGERANNPLPVLIYEAVCLFSITLIFYLAYFVKRCAKLLQNHKITK